MADCKQTFSRKGLTVDEILSLLESDDGNINNENIIYVEPPIELEGQATDEDSDKSDEEHDANLNHLGRKLLRTKCELRRFHTNRGSNQDQCLHESSSSSDSEDDVPLSTLKKGLQPAKKRRVDLWKKQIPNFSCTEFSQQIPSEEAFNCKTPTDFFKLFFNQELIKQIVDQSNIYAGQKNKQLMVTEDEIYVILGGMILSGYAKLPNKRLYFSRDNDVPKLLSENIRCNRFESILQNLHLNDNSQIAASSDRLYKLRPLLDSLGNSFQKHYGIDEHYSVDESMIPYYGKHYAKQFIRGKPIRFGFKNWALCASTGYMVAFSLYTGKSAEKKTFGLDGDVVLTLLDLAKLPSNNGIKMYFDNFFTSLSLLKHLREIGFYAKGTLRANRTENCPLKDVKMLKSEDRGYTDFRTADEVFVCRWKDNNVVTVATNFENMTMTTATRWSHVNKAKIALPQPSLISNYNKYMGGVDKCDQAIANLRTRMRIRKWWWPIFAYFVDVSIVNGWLLAKKVGCNKDTESLFAFRRHVARTLLVTHGTPPHQGRKPATPLSTTRFDCLNQWIVPINSERRCANKCGGKSKYKCQKCEVGLHPKCFMEYHVEPNT